MLPSPASSSVTSCSSTMGDNGDLKATVEALAKAVTTL
jgi:hypothetical protein